MNKQRTANSTLAIGGVSSPLDSFVVNQSLVLRINICGENRHHRQAPNRCASFCKTDILIERLIK
jgi:hypothetical protein